MRKTSSCALAMAVPSYRPADHALLESFLFAVQQSFFCIPLSEAILTHASSYQWNQDMLLKLWKDCENLSWQFNSHKERDSVRVLIKSCLENMGRSNSCAQEQKTSAQKTEGILALLLDEIVKMFTCPIWLWVISQSLAVIRDNT